MRPGAVSTARNNAAPSPGAVIVARNSLHCASKGRRGRRVHPKAVDARSVCFLYPCGFAYFVIERHEKKVREGRAKICAVESQRMRGQGTIHRPACGIGFTAARTEDLDCILLHLSVCSHWHHFLTSAQHARADPKVSTLILCMHSIQTMGCEDKACVDEPIQLRRGLPHLIVLHIV